MKKITIYAAAVAMVTLGSCNIINKGITRVNGSSGKSTPTTASNTTTAPTAKTPVIDENAIAGEWTIVAVGKTAISDREEMPYINFDNGRLYASNGCNVLNGSYNLADGRLSFSHMASTMRYCADVPFEHDINVVIADGTGYNVKTENLGHESYLYLMGENGQKLLTARRHNMGFLNGQWLVTGINGRPIDDEECNIFFDVAEGKVHGNTGCNYFNGKLYISPDRSNALELSNMGVTRMACPKTAQETSMLVALEETASAIRGNGNQVILLDKNGKQVMTLLRSENQNIDNE